MGADNKVCEVLLLFACISVFLSSCKAHHERSKPEGVDPPAIEVSQNLNKGFRWAYGLTEFIQSEHKKRSGENLNLSEEALGFYRMSENLARVLAVKNNAGEVIDEINCLGFYGLQSQNSEWGSAPNNFELLEKYGVVLEEAYPLKFSSVEQQLETFQGILERTKLMLSERQLVQISIADIQSKILIRPEDSKTTRSAFTSMPPRIFEFGGKSWDGKDFFSNHLDTVAGTFQNVEFDSADDFEKMITLIKISLSEGYFVPIDFGVDRRFLSEKAGRIFFTGKLISTVDPKDVQSRSKSECRSVEFRFPEAIHSSLIVDFVNIGSREGAFENNDQLDREVGKSASGLGYLKIKNEWGIDGPHGASWPEPQDGHFRIDREYLIASLESGVTLRIVIPKTIVARVGN